MTTDFGSLHPHLSAHLIAELNAGVPLLANSSLVDLPSSSSSPCAQTCASTLPPKRDLFLNSLVRDRTSANDFEALLHQHHLTSASTDEFGTSTDYLQQQHQGQLHPPRHEPDFVVEGLTNDSCDLVRSSLPMRGLPSSSSASSSSATLPPPLKIRTLDTGKATLDHFSIDPL